ncbi:MAG: GTP-binding protein [Verrucomicrobia bacterium]|nr:GTP-binding protein [Verrucomicrobiota bacterium]
MKILIVSGFLGAGKTTFIRQLIQRTGRELVVLENEYGQTSLDSREISAEKNVNVWEMLEGCVCCTMKENFSASILTISSTLDPEYLVVEPTGAARLGSLLENIGKISYEKISLLHPVVIVPPRGFHANLNQYGEIYRDQIRNAGTVVLSKIENEEEAVIREVCRRIRELNPAAEIVERPYKQMDDDWWHGLLLGEGEARLKAAAPEHGGHSPHLHSFTLKNVSLKNPAQLVILLQDLLNGEMGAVCRAKGTLKIGGEWVRFDMADGLFAVKGGEEGADPKTELVFIGDDIEKAKIISRFNTVL